MENVPALVNLDPKSGFLQVFLEGKTYKILATDSNFNKAIDAYKTKDWDNLHFIMNPSKRFSELYAKYEQIEVKHGNVYVNEEPISNVISQRILDMLNLGIDCVPMFKFITKLNLNPSSRAVNELYTFLEHKLLPITDNGNFLAYKALRSDYTDVHSGKYLNTVDSVLEMPRNKVDDDKEVGCSYGFHAGTYEYASGFRPVGGKLVLVEINPADVVSIPTDCNCQKLRTCKYKVVQEFEVPLDEPVYESRFTTEYDDDVDREWDDDDNDGRFACSGCGWNRHMCEECEYCVECCECSQDDEEEEEEPVQHSNKMQYLDWENQTVSISKLIGYLYSSRRPAVAQAIRRELEHYDDFTRVAYSILLKHTSEGDAYQIYLGMNP